MHMNNFINWQFFFLGIYFECIFVYNDNGIDEIIN